MKTKKIKSIFYTFSAPVKNVGGFKDFLIKKTEYLLCFHYFGSFSDKLCYYEIYKSGKLIYKKNLHFYKGKNIYLRYFFILSIYFYLLFIKCQRKSYVITQDPLLLSFSKFMEKIKKIRFVFWICDYYPRSKKKKSINKFLSIYNYLLFSNAKTLDYVLYLSPPLKNKLFYKGGIIRKLIPLGITNKTKRTNRKLINNNLIMGFIGIIAETHGLDLVIDYFDKIRPKNIVLEIIGEGHELNYYKKMINKLNLNDYIKTLGYVDNPERYFRRWHIGLALYKNRSDSLSKYCDPSKIKDYLSYSIPVITTKTTYFHKEIIEYKCGEVIDKETVKDLSKAINKIKKNYSSYMKGIEKIKEKYEYMKWYEDRFDFLFESK